MPSVVNTLLQKPELPRRRQGGAAAPALVARNDDDIPCPASNAARLEARPDA